MIEHYYRTGQCCPKSGHFPRDSRVSFALPCLWSLEFPLISKLSSHHHAIRIFFLTSLVALSKSELKIFGFTSHYVTIASDRTRKTQKISNEASLSSLSSHCHGKKYLFELNCCLKTHTTCQLIPKESTCHFTTSRIEHGCTKPSQAPRA